MPSPIYSVVGEDKFICMAALGLEFTPFVDGGALVTHDDPGLFGSAMQAFLGQVAVRSGTLAYGPFMCILRTCVFEVPHVHTNL